MKYKDYYTILDVARTATTAEVKAAYRKLAHKYHPDVSKDPAGEAKFKDASEAYQTLKDPDRRSAYDQLGSHQEGQQFRPGSDWEHRYAPESGDMHGFDDMDLADLFAGLSGGRAQRAGGHAAQAGRDYDVSSAISIEDACTGTQVDLHLRVPDYDAHGQLRQVERNVTARIPKGVTDGQRLRLRGQGGAGWQGGKNGDLYLNLTLRPHPLYHASGHDLNLDLPLTPWEAALGAVIDVPTPGGFVQLKVPAGTVSGRRLRLTGRGVPRQTGDAGDFYAVVRIDIPPVPTTEELALLGQLAAISTFNPRRHFASESTHAE